MTQWNYALASLGATITATGNDSGYPPSQAIDGSDVTLWKVNCNVAPQHIVIDLQTPQYIEEAITKAYRDTSVVGTWLVQYSSDNVNWNTIGTVPNTGDGSLLTGGVTARYWRFRVNSAYWNGTRAGFYTAALWGPIEAPPPLGDPNEQNVLDWLDSIDDNYRPIIDDWLAAHGY